MMKLFTVICIEAGKTMQDHGASFLDLGCHMSSDGRDLAEKLKPVSGWTICVIAEIK
jgi:hypothetical protein